MIDQKSLNLREIPYNYTSFSDKEIVNHLLGNQAWQYIENLRGQRKTGLSARMLFEILGDIWAIRRNPFLQEDLLENKKRRLALLQALDHRLKQIRMRATDNELALKLCDQAQQAIGNFRQWLSLIKDRRYILIRKLRKATKATHIDFSSIARIAHVTDATDWRLEFPFVVITPTREREISEVVKVCRDLGFTVIARGGGTGYTGSGIPIYEDTLILNLEKIDRLGKIRSLEDWHWQEAKSDKPILTKNQNLTHKSRIGVIQVGAGTVTRAVADMAQKENLIFAVDPTSINASTIGGNIAMNAGGKKAVAWGTTIDNLLAWRMIDANGHWVEVKRLGHPGHKIGDDQEARFSIIRYDRQKKRSKAVPELIRIPAGALRKSGLGKDVTDKVLCQLPGVQKEGTDGIITAATFILYPNPEFINTLCLEFYGHNLSEAVTAIEQIITICKQKPGVTLMALEHLDQRYLKAINYNIKAEQSIYPKMVLLADIGTSDAELLKQTLDEILCKMSKYQVYTFCAGNRSQREAFWSDRSRTAAIAAHTNAFKLNEDVVIPISRLDQYSREIEKINIEFSLRNKIEILDEFLTYLEHARESAETTAIEDKLNRASKLITKIKQQWQQLLLSLYQKVHSFPTLVDQLQITNESKQLLFIDLFLDSQLTLSLKKQILEPLRFILSGTELQETWQGIARLHSRGKTSRLFVATHMHAGDGNVHTNIPVNSNDNQMMRQAHDIVDRVMKLAKQLDGAISGEHGIGMTKYDFWSVEQKDAFKRYKQSIDPEQVFNRGKLLSNPLHQSGYTPSFRLVRQEALLLEQSEMELLNNQIRNCLRCGKCKFSCSTHVPRASLLYSPRNKILATGLLLEAFLYEEQTRRGVSTRHFERFQHIADHCTVCHKCKKVCPVDIDFGEVTMLMRRILRDRGQKKDSLAGKLAMTYLNLRDYRAIQLSYRIFLRFGFLAQRYISALWRDLNKITPNRELEPTTEKPKLIELLTHTINRPLPRLDSNTLRGKMGIHSEQYITILKGNQEYSNDLGGNESVIFFPGCGVERLHTRVGLACIVALTDLGVNVVLPPRNLCCGYPQLTSGYIKQSKSLSVENSVIFHRLANTLNYLDIKHFLVACGTCLKQLEQYNISAIFPECQLLDIHHYLFLLQALSPRVKDQISKQLHNQGQQDSSPFSYVYHDPCHSPFKNCNIQSLLESLLGVGVGITERCCGEAGTFAVQRPDIANQVRFRKIEELKAMFEPNRQNLTQNQKWDKENTRLLTSCPACLQGLARFRDEIKAHPQYIVEHLCELRYGRDWAKTIRYKARHLKMEKVLL